MADVSPEVRQLVLKEVSAFSKVPVSVIKPKHRLGTDLRLFKPALVHLAGSLRSHIRNRNPSHTLLVTEIEKPDFTVQQLIDLVGERIGSIAAWHNAALIRKLSVLFLAIFLCPAPALAQAASGWWSDIQVRKAFNGGRDEQQPASLAYVFRNDDAGGDFALVDLAIKYKALEREPGTGRFSPRLLLYPSIEWHRGEVEPLRGVASRFNKLSGAANLELYFGDVAGGDPARPVLAPWLFIKGEAARNIVKDSVEGNLTALTSVYSIRHWFPGADTAVAGRRLLKYAPYAGFEYYNNLSIESGGKVLAPSYTGWQFTLRLYTEIFPLMAQIPGENRLVITSEMYRRFPIAGTEVDGSFGALTLSVDLYLDNSQRFALGLSHDRGELPKANFAHQRRTQISFRVKL